MRVNRRERRRGRDGGRYRWRQTGRKVRHFICSKPGPPRGISRLSSCLGLPDSRQDDSDLMINIPAKGGPKSNSAKGPQKAWAGTAQSCQTPAFWTGRGETNIFTGGCSFRWNESLHMKATKATTRLFQRAQKRNNCENAYTLV